MQYLHKHTLYISNAKRSLEFYTNKLGMKLINSFKEENKEFYQLSFDDSKESKQAILELIYDSNNTRTSFPRNSEVLEGYWKIAICIKDVDIARENLIKNDVHVGVAFEVPNVAYLCHFNDPDGYCIELIQHKFQKNHIKETEDTNYILGNKPVFSLVTYRVKDINKSLDFYTKELGLKLYSKMDVSFRGFNIYFLAPNMEELPNKDVQSIENVEWLWQREFTMIELQHIFELENKRDFSYEVGLKTGFDKLTFTSNKNEALKDPDGYKIELIKSN